LIAAVGGVVLARRRGGLGEDESDRLTPLDILRPRGTGTMVEGVEGLALARARAGGANDSEQDDSDGSGGGW
jgi:hypothetical protein